MAYPVRLLMKRNGDMTFENLLRRLRCKRCQAVKPAPVYLVAGHHRTARGGPDPDWAIEPGAARDPARMICAKARLEPHG